MSVKGGKVYGSISDYKFALAIKFSKIPDVTVEELNSIFNTIFRVAIPQINSYLKNGIAIPPIPPLDLSKCEMTMLKQYIRLDITPELYHTEEFVKFAAEKLLKSFENVRRVRKVKQLKPANIPEWLQIEY